MAEKKYLDLTGLGKFKELSENVMDTKDAVVLASAKSHAEGLGSNYEQAGAVKTAQDALQANIDVVDGKVTANTNAIAAINHETTGILATAKAYTDTEAAKVQGEVNTLKGTVGTLPAEGNYTSVVDMITKKTEGIATNAALGELQTAVAQAKDDIDAIEADYLKADDKAELSGLITAEADARAAADTALGDRLEEVEAFFKLAEGEQLDTALDTLVEIQNYIATEGAAADQMVLDIAANKKAIEDEAARAEGAEEALGERVGVLEAIDHEAYIAADEELEEAIALKADQTAVDAIDAAYKAADSGLDTRLKAVEASIGEGGSVAEDIEGLQTSIDQLAATVDTKAAQSDLTALTGRVATAEGKVQTLESEMDAAEAAIAQKAAQTDLDALAATVAGHTTTIGNHGTSISSQGDRITALETKVGDGFAAITNAEVEGLFA